MLNVTFYWLKLKQLRQFFERAPGSPLNRPNSFERAPGSPGSPHKNSTGVLVAAAIHNHSDNKIDVFF